VKTIDFPVAVGFSFQQEDSPVILMAVIRDNVAAPVSQNAILTNARQNRGVIIILKGDVENMKFAIIILKILTRISQSTNAPFLPFKDGIGKHIIQTMGVPVCK
jgi:hypothetical protein